MNPKPTPPRGRLDFRDRPIRLKLAALLGLCATVTAAFVSGTLFAMTWWSLDEDARHDAAEVTHSLAFALRAPVAFEDRGGMQDALNVLKSRPHVRGAWVHGRDGVLLASWGEPLDRPADVRPGGGLLAGRVNVTVPLSSRDGGDPLGTVSVYVDLSERREMLAWQAVAALAAALTGLGLSLWISARWSQRLSAPILDLAETASAIASGREYDRRLQAVGNDEVGRAVRAFNAMIDEVQRRGDALIEMNRALEQLVVLRTQAMERAEAASIAKTRFLSNMSHELRSPLNGVIGAAQLLQASPAGDRRDELVSIIRTSGTNLLGLIDSILDLARIEAGAMELHPQEFDLLDCIDAAVATSAVPARVKGLQMAVVVDPSVEPTRHGDALRLRQVLLNLLGNAVKFTLQGEVVLQVKTGRVPGELIFQVSDTGIGMDASAVQTVFEPFRQGDESTTRRFGGSGLGLTICRQVVHLMGGQIDLESRLGEGSCFSVTLPLPLTEAQPSAADPHDVPVAYWEPHDTSAAGLKALLDRLGHRSVRCGSAESALDFAAQRKGWLLVAADAPHGIALIESVQAAGGGARVIVMTGAEAVRHPRHWRSSMTKPVQRNALVSRLGAALAPVPLPTELPKAVAPEPGALVGNAVRVLVVEDEPVNQAIVSSMLTNAGFAIDLASDGATALEQFPLHHYDLVLMDWQMPDMDGLEVTRRLRAGAAGEHGIHVPILALTANAFAEDRAACMAAGMNDFLTKPVHASDLVGAALRWTRGAARPAA